MGEHGVSLEKYDFERCIYDSKHSIATQNTLFVNQMTQNTLFYGIYGNGWKITTYALGEHDWVTSKWENIKENVEPYI